jgi:MATE family multidrug resistance protein
MLSTYWLRYRSLYKENLQLALPVVMSQLGHITVAVADNVMVGRVGTIPLAAAALANSVFVIFLVFGLGLSNSIGPLVAEAMGANKSHRVKELYSGGFSLLMGVGAALFLLLLATYPLLGYLGQDPAVVDAAGPYFIVISGSLVPLLMYQAFRQVSEGLSDTRSPMIITLVGNGLNVFLNYLLIYGSWGFPEWGLLGAGLGTLGSRIFMAWGMWYALHRNVTAATLNLHLERPRFKRMRKIWNTGWPIGTQGLFEVSAFALSAIMIGWFGAAALAAHQVAINMASVTFMAASGISAAAAIKVGTQFGRQDMAGVRDAGASNLHLGLAFMGLCGLLFALFRHQLPALYSSDPGVIALSAQLLIWAAFFQLSDGAQVIILGSLRGMGDVRFPTVITFVAYWVVALPLAYVLGKVFNLGAMGIWAGLSIGLTIAAIWLVIRFFSRFKTT